jgi:hypothetical protein
MRGRTSSAPAWIVARLEYLAEAADRDVDDAGGDRTHRRFAETEPLDHPGPEILDEDVGAFAQPEQRAAPGRGLEVHRDRALVAVVVEERCREPVAPLRRGAGRITPLERLDLDHVGTLVAEDHRRQRPGDVLRQVDDAIAPQGSIGERAGHEVAYSAATARAASAGVKKRRPAVRWFS